MQGAALGSLHWQQCWHRAAAGSTRPAAPGFASAPPAGCAPAARAPAAAPWRAAGRSCGSARCGCCRPVVGRQQAERLARARAVGRGRLGSWRRCSKERQPRAPSCCAPSWSPAAWLWRMLCGGLCEESGRGVEGAARRRRPTVGAGAPLRSHPRLHRPPDTYASPICVRRSLKTAGRAVGSAWVWVAWLTRARDAQSMLVHGSVCFGRSRGRFWAGRPAVGGSAHGAVGRRRRCRTAVRVHRYDRYERLEAVQVSMPGRVARKGPGAGLAAAACHSSRSHARNHRPPPGSAAAAISPLI